MTLKGFSIIRLAIVLLIGITTAVAFVIGNLFLAIAGLLIGALFVFLVRQQYKHVIIDERVLNVSGHAARLTHLSSTLLLGIVALFLIFSGQQNDEFYVESLGVVISYVALFNITLYAIFFHYFNKKYGGTRE
ncbi:MAG: DUF2178 domain-containing protein [Patescibacteria group bacterium]